MKKATDIWNMCDIAAKADAINLAADDLRSEAERYHLPDELMEPVHKLLDATIAVADLFDGEACKAMAAAFGSDWDPYA